MSLLELPVFSLPSPVGEAQEIGRPVSVSESETGMFGAEVLLVCYH